jgi:hypothetical protein
MRPLPPVAAEFEREHGCTETEWLGWLPGAVGVHALRLGPAGQALVSVGSGELRLLWGVLPPRRIALISMPRMNVRYRFAGLSTDERTEFMRYFDLYMQRGGG